MPIIKVFLQFSLFFGAKNNRISGTEGELLIRYLDEMQDGDLGEFGPVEVRHLADKLLLLYLYVSGN